MDAPPSWLSGVWEPCSKRTLYKQQINQTHLTRAEGLRNSLWVSVCEAGGRLHRLQWQEALHRILPFLKDSEAKVSELRSLSLQTKGALLSVSCVH